MDEALFQKRLKDLEEIIKTQTSNGNWNYDPYMHGMANGLILAHWIMMGIASVEPPYLDAPKEWLKDKPSTGEAPVSSCGAV